ncbi:hypothetical protein [Actinoplanes xinjiangensis]|uniref:hypothetical protein n=1 Tax=Actinoplanes xinjiangensis TaxID=512350 RepID=UPI00342E4BDA
MRVRPPLPLAACLLAVVAALSACGSAAEPGSDTSGVRAPTGATRPGVLSTRSDLVDAQVVQWREWRSVDDRTIEVTVTAGPADCYGAEPEVTESETAVRVRIRVGLLPEAVDKDCPAIAKESVVPVRLASALGDRKVEPLS